MTQVYNERQLSELQSVMDGTHPMFSRDQVIRALESLVETAKVFGLDYENLSISELIARIAECEKRTRMTGAIRPEDPAKSPLP